MLTEGFSCGEKIVNQFVFVRELGENGNHSSKNLMAKT